MAVEAIGGIFVSVLANILTYQAHKGLAAHMPLQRSNVDSLQGFTLWDEFEG